MARTWLLLVALLLPLIEADEDTKTHDLVDGKGVIFDQKGRYIDTAAVFYYFLVFWLIILFLCTTGCINLCMIRRHFILKAKQIIEQLETDRKKQLDAEAQEPSLFGHPFPRVPTEQIEEQRKHREAHVLWDPTTLAQVLHNIAPNSHFVEKEPFRGVCLVSGENTLNDSDNGNPGHGPLSNAPASSLNQAASTGNG